jgi:hypothetical protein
MKRYRLSLAASMTHEPQHPERTARRASSDPHDLDDIYQTWPTRAAMARAIRKEQQRPPKRTDWRPCVGLTPGEGF